MTSVFVRPAGKFALDPSANHMRIGTPRAWAIPSSYCTQADLAARSDHTSTTASARRIVSVMTPRTSSPTAPQLAGSSTWAPRSSDSRSQLRADCTSGRSSVLYDMKTLCSLIGSPFSARFFAASLLTHPDRAFSLTQQPLRPSSNAGPLHACTDPAVPKEEHLAPPSLARQRSNGAKE